MNIGRTLIISSILMTFMSFIFTDRHSNDEHCIAYLLTMLFASAGFLITGLIQHEIDTRHNDKNKEQ